MSIGGGGRRPILKYRDKYDAAYKKLSEDLGQGSRAKEIAAKLPTDEVKLKKDQSNEDFVILQNSLDSAKPMLYAAAPVRQSPHIKS